MCYMLYLGSMRPLPTTADKYLLLSVQPIKDDTVLSDTEANLSEFTSWPDHSRAGHPLSEVKFIYQMLPEGLCGCYFEHPAREELEDELLHASDIDMNGWVSKVAFPDLDPKEGARLWWERKNTAVRSLGYYLCDHVQNGLVLYVVWAATDEEQLPTLQQQTIPPSYFSKATSLALPDNTLFTIVPD